jgi:hypothetical protein
VLLIDLNFRTAQRLFCRVWALIASQKNRSQILPDLQVSRIAAHASEARHGRGRRTGQLWGSGSAYRGAGVYVARTLKGEKPSDLPFELATKFDLAINLKTAKTLGVNVPPGLSAIGVKQT